MKVEGSFEVETRDAQSENDFTQRCFTNRKNLSEFTQDLLENSPKLQ